MTAFLTLTPNPALDIATRTERVEPTHKLRCDTVQRFPGGGGVNVARVLHRLGAEVQAWTATGGPAGAQLVALLQAEGVPTLAYPVHGDTRENIAVLETETGHEFRFVLPGPTWTQDEWNAALPPLGTHLREARPGLRWLIGSGSLPPGVPDDFYAQAAAIARQHGVGMALDTSGKALAAALRTGVQVVKPSLRELRELLQQPLEDITAACTAARSLVLHGQAETVALSMGEQGAVLATRQGAWHAPALQVPASTGTTGAGDCFLATLLWALDSGQPAPEALRWGVAAGAAALLAPGTTLARVEDIHRLHASAPVPTPIITAG